MPANPGTSQRLSEKTVNGFNSRCLNVITKEGYRVTATTPKFNLVLAIRKRRIRYIGHILWMDEDRLVRRTLLAYVCSKTHGIPAGSLMDDEICKNRSVAELSELAKDRRRWKNLISKMK